MTQDVDVRVSIRTVRLDELSINPLFSDLFPREAEVTKRIARSMRAEGFDIGRPVDVWRNKTTLELVEGHQRVEAARQAGLTEVPAAYRHFADEAEALQFAVRAQADRRNMDREAQTLAIIRKLDELAGGVGKGGGRTNLVKRYGFADATVKRARILLARGKPSEIAAVFDGTHGLRQAYELLLEREQQDQAADVEIHEKPRKRASEHEDKVMRHEEKVKRHMDEIRPEIDKHEIEYPLDADDEPESPTIPELVALREAAEVVRQACDSVDDMVNKDIVSLSVATRVGPIEDIVMAVEGLQQASEQLELTMRSGS